jgi:hypothetical protein
VRASGLAPDLTLRRALGLAATASAVLLGLLLFRAPYFGIGLRLWLVSLAAVFVWALTGRVLAHRPVGDGPGAVVHWNRLRWWRGGGRGERVRGLEELEHAVEFSLTTAFDLHYRLRPHLVRIAAHRLAQRGVDLDAEPQRARDLLGPEAWELVRPDRPAPERRNARGLELDRLRRVMERLSAV